MENGENCHGKVMEFYYQISVGTLYQVSRVSFVVSAACIRRLCCFQNRANMQLFVRAQQTHVVDVTGDETVGDIKVRVYIINLSTVLYAYLSMYPVPSFCLIATA